MGHKNLNGTMCISYVPIIVAGPSGVGKSTVIRRVLNAFPEKFGFSVSHTTREPRPGEENGTHYHFVTKDQMEDLISQGEFIEHAIYNNNYYGTSKQSIKNLQDQKKIGLLDIDMTGVASIQNSGFPAKFVFIEPPSFEELRRRLIGRKDTSEDAIERRIAIAEKELEERKHYKWDFVMVGDTLDQTYDDFCTFLGLKEK